MNYFYFVKVEQILGLLSNSILDELAIETQVDKYAKKLTGRVIFNLLIHCILSYKDNCLRRMEP